MQRSTLASLVAARSVDAHTAALLWLLTEGGLPVVVTGAASLSERCAVAAAIASAIPRRARVLLDLDADVLTTERLTALLRGGVGLALTITALDLRDLLVRLEHPDIGLPEDAIRRLGMVVVVEHPMRGLRLRSTHYLRPSERDAQGHIQRRPPAVLATWDAGTDSFDDFAWGITPELADRVDRSQADFEQRQRSRGAFLAALATRAPLSHEVWEAVAGDHLATEPPRVPAPPREAAKPSPFGGGLIDHEQHTH